MTTTTTLAVYRDGVLRPAEPLPLAEGTEVRITVTPAETTPPQADPLEALRGITKETPPEEMWAIFDAVAALDPPLPEGYDFLAALEENRKQPWFRPRVIPGTEAEDAGE